MNRASVAVAWVALAIASPAAAEPPRAPSSSDAAPSPAPTRSADEQPITVRFPVRFEPPYKLGTRPVLQDPRSAERERLVLVRWNEGGRAGSWHPAPRVMVDNPRVNGSIRAATVLRTARAKGYWLIRTCYDAALVEQQDLRGKLTVRFTIRQSGATVRPAIVGKPTLGDDKVVQCIRRSVPKISFPRIRRDASATIDIAVNPGDAPIRAPRDDTPGPGQIDAPLAQGALAADAGAAIQQCYVDGVRRMPGLWGRMVLLADVAPDGTIRDLTETESTFPDPQTTACVSSALRSVALPSPDGGDLRLVIPIRFGSGAP